MLKTYTGTVPASATVEIANINELVGLTNAVKVKTVRVLGGASGVDITANSPSGNAIVARTTSAIMAEAEDFYLSNSGYVNELSVHGVGIINKTATPVTYYIALEDA